MNLYAYGRLGRSDQEEGRAGVLGIDAAWPGKEPGRVALKFLVSEIARCPYRNPEGEERIRRSAVLRPA
jgi:hypothetical protein